MASRAALLGMAGAARPMSRTMPMSSNMNRMRLPHRPALLALCSRSRPLALRPPSRGEPAPAFALPDASGETVALDKLQGQRRLRRLLGVVVRAVPALVSVDERDAAEVRRAGLHGRRDQRRQEARATPSASWRRRRRRSRSSTTRPAATPAAYDVKGMPSSYLIDAAATSSPSSSGFLDEHEGRARGAHPRAAGRATDAMRSVLRMRSRARDRRRCARRSPAARRSTPPQAVGEGRPRASRRCSSTPTSSTRRRSSTSTRARKPRPAATASAEAAVAATEARPRRRAAPAARRLAAPRACAPARSLAAALALPGIAARRRARAVGARPGHLRSSSTSTTATGSRAPTG